MLASYDAHGATYGSSRSADPALARKILELLRLDLAGSYLDVGCGSGNYTCALAAAAGRWHGVDPSEVMLAQARAACSRPSWQLASVNDLPFAAGTFDGVLCTNAIHHFGDLVPAFAEVRRVMRPGRFVIFTGFAEQAANYWLCHYFPQMMKRTVEISPTESSVRIALKRAGFERAKVSPFFVTEGLRDLFLYSGKCRPELYLRGDVRANTTSFARHCEADELEQGIARLAVDIESGAIAEVRRRYSDELGDYAFVSAEVGA